MAAPLVFITNRICPFAHRVWLVLLESGTAFETREAAIAPGTKPEWFTAAYRAALGADPASDGKVPTLIDGDFSLTESAVVAEYVAGKAAPALLPASPRDRAEAALFVSQGVDGWVKAFYPLLMAQDEAAQAKAAADLVKAAGTLATWLGRRGGPYLLGAAPTLPDFLLWPFLERLSVLAHYRGFALPTDAAYAPLHAFVAAMGARPSVVAAKQDPAFFIEGYAGYANPGKKA
jgi:glutathione S-transferase